MVFALTFLRNHLFFALTFFEQSLSPQEICEQLSFFYRIPIIPGETLLFFDEIQSCFGRYSVWIRPDCEH